MSEEPEYEEYIDTPTGETLQNINAYMAAIHEQQASMGADLEAIKAQMKSDELIRLMVADDLMGTMQLVRGAMVLFYAALAITAAGIVLSMVFSSHKDMVLTCATLFVFLIAVIIAATVAASKHISAVRMALGAKTQRKNTRSVADGVR